MDYWSVVRQLENCYLHRCVSPSCTTKELLQRFHQRPPSPPPPPHHASSPSTFIHRKEIYGRHIALGSAFFRDVMAIDTARIVMRISRKEQDTQDLVKRELGKLVQLLKDYGNKVLLPLRRQRRQNELEKVLTEEFPSLLETMALFFRCYGFDEFAVELLAMRPYLKDTRVRKLKFRPATRSARENHGQHADQKGMNRKGANSNSDERAQRAGGEKEDINEYFDNWLKERERKTGSPPPFNPMLNKRDESDSDESETEHYSNSDDLFLSRHGKTRRQEVTTPTTSPEPDILPPNNPVARAVLSSLNNAPPKPPVIEYQAPQSMGVQFRRPPPPTTVATKKRKLGSKVGAQAAGRNIPNISQPRTKASRTTKKHSSSVQPPLPSPPPPPPPPPQYLQPPPRQTSFPIPLSPSTTEPTSCSVSFNSQSSTIRGLNNIDINDPDTDPGSDADHEADLDYPSPFDPYTPSSCGVPFSVPSTIGPSPEPCNLETHHNSTANSGPQVFTPWMHDVQSWHLAASAQYHHLQDAVNPPGPRMMVDTIGAVMQPHQALQQPSNAVSMSAEGYHAQHAHLQQNLQQQSPTPPNPAVPGMVSAIQVPVSIPVQFQSAYAQEFQWAVYPTQSIYLEDAGYYNTL